MPNRPTADLIPPGALAAETVRRHLDAARERLVVLTGDLDGERLLGPKLAIVNPPLWEIGHVAWFQEHWCLRMRPDGTLAPSRLADADRLYDSTADPARDPLGSAAAVARRDAQLSRGGARRRPRSARAAPRRRAIALFRASSPRATRTCTARRSTTPARPSATLRLPSRSGRRLRRRRERGRGRGVRGRQLQSRCSAGHRLRPRQREMGPRRARGAVPDRPHGGDQPGVRRIRGRRRLRAARVVDGRGLDPGARRARRRRRSTGGDRTASGPNAGSSAGGRSLRTSRSFT